MRNELENPMVVGDYYEQPKIYDACAECGGPIYEGDWFHIVGRGLNAMKVCDECSSREVAQIRE